MIYAIILSSILHGLIIFSFNGNIEKPQVIEQKPQLTVTIVKTEPKWKPSKGLIKFTDNPANTPDTWYTAEDEERDKKDKDKDKFEDDCL